jgi:transposase
MLDNARIHHGSENKALVEWLWRRFNIFVAWLPIHSPELNPIELI